MHANQFWIVSQQQKCVILCDILSESTTKISHLGVGIIQKDSTSAGWTHLKIQLQKELVIQVSSFKFQWWVFNTRAVCPSIRLEEKWKKFRSAFIQKSISAASKEMKSRFCKFAPGKMHRHIRERLPKRILIATFQELYCLPIQPIRSQIEVAKGLVPASSFTDQSGFRFHSSLGPPMRDKKTNQFASECILWMKDRKPVLSKWPESPFFARFLWCLFVQKKQRTSGFKKGSFQTQSQTGVENKGFGSSAKDWNAVFQVCNCCSVTF